MLAEFQGLEQELDTGMWWMDLSTGSLVSGFLLLFLPLAFDD